MPFQTVKLLPGVKILQTPTLLQANVCASNLIRWKGGLPEKYGGWSNFLVNLGTGGPSNVTVGGITRELCAWTDLNITNHLAIAGSAGLDVLTPTQGAMPAIQSIEAQYAITTSGATFSTTAGSPIVTIYDPGAQINNYSSVQIQSHVTIGGLVLFGSYPVSVITGTQYLINAGQNAPATAYLGAPCVAAFATAANTELVTVTLGAHGMSVGQTFSIPLPTSVGGIILHGFYRVEEVIDANRFVFFAEFSALYNDSQWEGNMPGGNPQILYWVTQAPLLPNSGWGVGGWGVGGWGSGQQPAPLSGSQYPPPDGTPGFAQISGDDWCLANWGSTLLSSAINGPIFAWDPTSGLPNSQKIANGPSYCTGFFIGMPEQQIIAYGASTFQIQDPMLIAWCDNANYNVWAAAVNNQAGTFRLPRGSKIISGIQGPQQAMLWTDVGLWVMQYIGYPNVFGFNEVAQGCGLIGKHAHAVYGPQVFWMAKDAFWVYANGSAQRMQCDVWDVIIKNLNNARDTDGDYLWFHHIRGAANSGFDEVAWHFPSKASTNGENDSWVKLNTVTGEWDYSLSNPQTGMIGKTPINVTAWLDNNIFGHPISSMVEPITGTTSYIFQHEMGSDANGQPINWMVQTGFFMLSEGEDKVFVDYVLPDFRWRRWENPQSESAQVQITLYTADDPDNPNAPPVAYGPYVVTNRSSGFEPRCRGRYFYGQIQGNDVGSFVRLGGLKFRFAPDGRN